MQWHWDCPGSQRVDEPLTTDSRRDHLSKPSDPVVHEDALHAREDQTMLARRASECAQVFLRTFSRFARTGRKEFALIAVS
jgi:hypothetical protein